ncbi:hypothetical protein TELCIR_09451 [Teladorsagia circumcincta]|uniref:Repulsive guidance molecule C-terminal domain-containing protein n=1 Tax=Teladorsagia circumcincta TaxID=45464 RepID=A0A2G9UES5_TELCI|nr:hypothetical protein TELCIR_09451 [Teladorsagia circumcincta]
MDEVRCNFLPRVSEARMRMCTLFGDPHLLRFDGTMQSCTEEGARPFVDNRHFLIQVTNSNVRNQAHTTAVNKITLLIRNHNCTPSLRYEAASDEETLPISFVDGVTGHETDDHRKTVEEWSSAKCRRYQHMGTLTSSESLCTTGCRNRSIIEIDKVLAASNKYARCYARKLHVPIKLAIGEQLEP